MAQQLKKKFIGNNEVDGSKILLENNQAIRAKDQAGVEQDVLKLDAADKVVVKSSTGFEEIGLKTDITAVEDDVTNLVTLSGVDRDSTDLGAFTGLTPIISTGSTIKEALQDLSDAVDAISGGGSGSLSALQQELDNTQAGAGLDPVTGGYSAPAVSNYLSAAVSLKDADSKLDVAIKDVADDLQAHLDNTVDAHDATAISFSNVASDMTATTVQGAIDEVEARVDTLESDVADVASDLQDHISASVDAHDASAISLSPAINGQTNVQSSLADHESRIATVEAYDTDDIEEGINNLYFTDARARTAAVADIITDGVVNIAPSQNAVYDALELKLDLAGGTMSGNIAMGNNSITNLVMTSDAHSAATRQYVDTVAEGLHVHAPARLLAAVALGGDYNNGSSGIGAHIDFTTPISSIDDVSSFSVGDRIILAFQNGSALDPANGIYYIEDAADININGHIIKLTRTQDFDSPAEMAGGDFIFVQEGDQYADSGWVMTETVVAVGTTPVQFLQFSGAGAYTAGDGLDLTGTVFSVNVSELVGDGIEDDGSNNFKVKVSDIAGAGLESDGANNLQIAASAAGNALSLSAGVLSVNVDNSTIEIATDSLQVKDAGIVEAKLASLSVSTAKIQDNAVDKSKIASDVAGAGLAQNVDGSLEIALSAAGDGLSLAAGVLAVNVGDGIQISSDAVAAKVSDFAGDGLEDDLSNNLKIKLDTDSALAVAATGLKVDTSIAGDGLDMASGVMSVNVSDIAGNGLESDGGSPANLRIKLDGSSLAVSASGLKSNIEWNKEKYSVTSNLTTGAFFDLDFVAEVNSISAFVDRLAIHEDDDFTVSYTGGVGGVTRITFIGALIDPGQSQLINGDSVYFKYQKKIS